MLDRERYARLCGFIDGSFARNHGGAPEAIAVRDRFTAGSSACTGTPFQGTEGMV